MHELFKFSGLSPGYELAMDLQSESIWNFQSRVR